jgi:hypothetical protein
MHYAAPRTIHCVVDGTSVLHLGAPCSAVVASCYFETGLVFTEWVLSTLEPMENIGRYGLERQTIRVTRSVMGPVASPFGAGLRSRKAS